MDYKIQILSLLYSFVYGIFFYFLNILNDKFLNKNKIINTIILVLFVFVNALLYITVLYKINYGVFHIYFLFMLFLGYGLASIIKIKILFKIHQIFKKK